MLKKILLVLAALIIIIQFFRPERNESDDNTYHIANKYAIPENVNIILQKACRDCHTNKTEYPWYSNVQPVAWWMADHVKDGKRHLNLSAFTNRPIAWQNHKLEEIIEQVKEKEMPLPYYTWLGLHSAADISEEERVAITSWAAAQMDTLKKNYPPDSLVMKRRPG